MQITIIGLDLAKHLFQVHGVDAAGKVAVKRRLHLLVAVGRSTNPFMVKSDPTTLYIYPAAADVAAVAQAVAAGRSPASAGLYWNASCLKEIGAPKFWSRETLEPILARYKRDHPAPPPRPLPICKEP